MEKIKVKNGKDIVFRKEEEDAFIFTPEDSNIRTLNGTAAFIWRLIEQGRDYQEILKSLSDEYPEVEKEKIKNDLDGFIKELKRRGLLES